MYVLVRFLEGHDPHMRHVIVVSDIQDFRPADTSDFDNKSIYDAFWSEGVEDNTGFYSAQVLALGTEKSRTSSDSDGPSAHDSEMRQAENSFWKKCTLLQEDNLFLQEQLKGYQRFSAPKSFNPLRPWRNFITKLKVGQEASIFLYGEDIVTAQLHHHQHPHYHYHPQQRTACTGGVCGAC
ncbi:hypothetical protein HPB47_013401 [Ixodes persulcatus]|uniref:Uncharacterized protein n=1 Tax=Ixodes persulcatus TaxID=34615 RepID=A0AC60R3Z7_IXOPE|nr:hypothetical protein HPB47_013401 [Ixodes persulcatus]